MEQTKRILVVEDDQHIADLICLHLRDEQFEVTHSADGDEGMRLLQQGHWDALILDLMLPGVDGLEICRRARAMARYTPIIITSARSSELHRILGLELGADDYLAKPFSMLELVARVKALLRRVDAMARNLKMDAGSAGVIDGLCHRSDHPRSQPRRRAGPHASRVRSCCTSSPVNRAKCSRAWIC
jgi:two-component system OmpR family response regulator